MQQITRLWSAFVRDVRFILVMTIMFSIFAVLKGVQQEGGPFLFNLAMALIFGWRLGGCLQSAPATDADG
jgi:hypothetical protein